MFQSLRKQQTSYNFSMPQPPNETLRQQLGHDCTLHFQRDQCNASHGIADAAAILRCGTMPMHEIRPNTELPKARGRERRKGFRAKNRVRALPKKKGNFRMPGCFAESGNYRPKPWKAATRASRQMVLAKLLRQSRNGARKQRSLHTPGQFVRRFARRLGPQLRTSLLHKQKQQRHRRHHHHHQQQKQNLIMQALHDPGWQV